MNQVQIVTVKLLLCILHVRIIVNTNFTFGHIDTQEQSIRMVCECVMKNHNNQSIQIKASTISRKIPPTTKEYVEVLSKKMEEYMKIVDNFTKFTFSHSKT